MIDSMFGPRWAALLEAARAGSSVALGEILETCRPYLLLVASRELPKELQAREGASDLVQESLCHALKGFEDFAGGTEEEWRGWLRRILLNNLVNLTRRHSGAAKRQAGRERALEDNGALQLIDAALSPSKEVVRQEESEQLWQRLRELPENYRRVLVLRYQDGQSFEQIGAALDLTPNAARKLWLRAMQRLKRDWETPP